MTQDAEDFLGYMLDEFLCKEKETGTTENKGATCECTIYDVEPSMLDAVEGFLAGFRAFLSARNFDFDRLDYLGRSFGANCYCSLNGGGVGFFDEYDDPERTLGDELQERLIEYAGRYRFEHIDLYNHEDGGVNLSFMREFIPEFLEKTFGNTNQ